MIGVVSRISHVVLGLTVLAWSNSTGDLIADVRRFCVGERLKIVCVVIVCFSACGRTPRLFAYGNFGCCRRSAAQFVFIMIIILDLHIVAYSL